ncbi:MAG: CARDB domain-containing protein [Candidatus Bathyarchaeia archaeon]
MVFAGVPSEPHDANAMWIEPSSLDLTTASIGHKFNLTIWLNLTTLGTATAIQGWQFNITYNTQYLNITRYALTNNNITSELFQGIITMGASFSLDEAKGYIMVAEATSIGVVKPLPCSGSLTWIEFEVANVPPKQLTMYFNFSQSDTYIADAEFNYYYPPDFTTYSASAIIGAKPTYTLTITAATGGTTNPAPGVYSHAEGTVVSVKAIPQAGNKLDYWELDGVNVGNPNPIQVTMDADHMLKAFFAPLGTVLYVDPPEIIDPTKEPCQNFAVNITINDVGDMKTCEFSLTYDKNIVTVVGFRVLKVQDQTPTSIISWDNEIGCVWVKLTYKSPITTAIPTPLVEITFHVEARGVTVLDLTNTTITNSVDEQIPHTAIDGFFASLLQDLSITNVVLSHNWVYKGQSVNIDVTVKNLGNQKESFDVSVYYDSTLIGTQHFTDLAPNAETILTFIWDTSATEPCRNYTITANVTILPYETNTADNTYIDGSVKVYARDIAITNVVTSSNWVYPGRMVKINVTAMNLGDLEESFDVKAYYDDQLIDIQNVTSLLPNEGITLTFSWNTSTAEPCHNYTIKCEATILPYEQNTSNNVYVDGKVKVRFVGDVNGDNAVNLTDILLTKEAYGSYPGHPRWKPEADLDQNNCVDLMDILIVRKNFGKGCTS